MLVAGAQLGNYQVQQILGHGRSGSAYLAVHLRLKQFVVLKLFPLDKASSFLWESARAECLYVAQIRHGSILPVLSCGVQRLEERPNSSTALITINTSQENNVLLTIRQYVRYPLLSFLSHVQREEAQGARAMSIIQQIGSALSAVHARNVVHGALNPGNLLFDEQEQPWIADFGLARLHPPSVPYLAPELYTASRTSIQTGNMTLFWEAVTPASDQYAFALLCQQLLSHVLQREDYERGTPALQRATHQQPTRRFPSIDTFTAELFTLLSRRRTNLLGEGSMPSSRNAQLSPQEAQGYDGEMQQSSSAGNALRAWVSGKTPAALPGPDPISVLEKRAGKLFTMRNYDAAIQVYQQALALDATRDSIWLALGDAFLASEQYAEALKAYERAISLNPNNSLAWSNSGAALDALGRHREALARYERASQLDG